MDGYHDIAQPADGLSAWLGSVGAPAGVEPFVRWAPPGHFYSPIPGAADLARPRGATELPGVDLGTGSQVELAERLAPLATAFTPPRSASLEWRYHADNPMFSLGDAALLSALLRLLRPGRVVEVGSGWSSAVILDTVDRWLDDEPDLVFVEPYPDNLHRLLRDTDRHRVTVFERPVQELDPAIITGLRPGDVLFIDSSHVVKTGSDVNLLLLELVPRLERGVWIHVHDVVYPFEVPDQWLEEGRMWSETYLLRALLTFSDSLRIALWPSFLAHRYHADLARLLPACVSDPGTSIWLER